MKEKTISKEGRRGVSFHPYRELTDKSSEKSSGTVKVLDKAILILDMLHASKIPLGVNEISRNGGISAASAYRILKTFKGSGWVYQNEEGKYMIGYKVSYVTEKNNFWLALKETAYYTMSRLSAETSQAMNLIVREYEKCFILQQSRTDKIVDYVPPVGTVLPIYACAGGKALLAELPPSLLNQILSSIVFKPLTPYTITSKEVFMEQLEQCKKQGYALDMRESQEEGFCIAVPLRGPDNEVIAALSFSGILGGIPSDKIQEYSVLLKKAANEISSNLFLLHPEK